jgi:hypothetical protein
MAVIYFYCDESGKHKAQPVINVTGVGVSKDRHEKFDREWEALLRSYEIPELHMSRIADLTQRVGHMMPSNQSIDARMDALLPFADCINQTMEYGLVQAWDVKGYAHLTLDVKRVLGGANDPYFMAFVRGALEIVDHVGEKDRVVIVCDDDLATAWDTYLHYRAVRDAHPEFRKKTVGITFADSEHFPALQAADMVAFLGRLQARSEFYSVANDWKRLYEYVTTPPSGHRGIMRWYRMFADEKQLRALALSMLELQEQGKIGKPKD